MTRISNRSLPLTSNRLMALCPWILCTALLVAVNLAQSADSSAAPNAALAPRTLLFSQLIGRDDDAESPITALDQDDQGYLWIGTQEGLKRYDGDEIVTFEHRYDDPDSLAADWVWTIYVDRDGTLWVGTLGGGLDRFVRDTGGFAHYQHDPDDPGTLSGDSVRVVYQDRGGVHWIGTEGAGLNRLDPQTGRITRFQHDPLVADSLPDDRVLAITEDRTGNLWVGTNGGGLSRLDRASGRFEHFQHDPADPGSLSDNKVRALFEDREGRFWVGTYEGGLNLFEPETGSFRHYLHNPQDPTSLSDNRVRDIHQDRSGTLWVGTDGGLNEWRPADDGFAHYDHNPIDDSSLSDNRVTALFQDRGGVLWVGTYFGLNKWNYLSDAFTYYQTSGPVIKLSSNIVTAVDETHDDVVWVGTYGGGLNRLDLASSSVAYYGAADPDNPQGGLPNDRVMALYVDESRHVWISTREGGLSRLDPQTEIFTHFANDPADPTSISSNNITSILSATPGSVWVGTYGGGLNLLDTRSGRAEIFRHDPDDATSIGDDRVLALYRDRQGSLWIGTDEGGLNRFDAASRTFERIRHDPEDASSLSSDTAWAIHEGGDGSLWIGTNGGGLNRWRPDDRLANRVSFQRYRKSDGLRSDTIQAILEDSAGFIWLSTNRGLAQMDPDSEAIRRFSRTSGLKGSEFNFDSSLRSASGRLFFGGTSGLVGFHPSEINTNRHRPEIVVEAYNRQGPMDTRYSVQADDSMLELAYPNDLITFKFSGLDYTAPSRNRYRYQLEGFDEQWRETLEVRRATYTNLPAGDYSFRVQAANNDGFWNESGVSVPLRVIPPPWRSPAAYIAYVVLTLGAVAAVIRTQAAKLQRETTQRHELEKQVTARTEELAQRNVQLESLNLRLKESSWTDSLTGMKNRRFLNEFVEEEVALALRRTRESKVSEDMPETLDIAPALAFMMIDLDGFKLINDQYGHHAGDEALVQVRDIFLRCCRKSDTLIRWGGDEFLVVGRNTSNRAAEMLAERIRGELANYQFVVGDGKVARMTASIGFAVYPFCSLRPELVSWEQITTIADQCAYLAKANGRNAWVGIHGNRDTTAQDVASLGTDLERLVQQGAVGLRTSISQPLEFTNQRRVQTT